MEIVGADSLHGCRNKVVRITENLCSLTTRFQRNQGRKKQFEGVPLPCRFDVYDLNGNKAISVEEFLSATKGFTKMDRKILFERLDRNVYSTTMFSISLNGHDLREVASVTVYVLSFKLNQS
uniref:Uncharacterized protein n=1 Tax=Magallana gigas TaxID=29159 RepID=K1P4E8_MAGGI